MPVVGILASLPLSAGLGVVLSPSVPSPQPVGTTIVWTANSTGTANPVAYRYTISYLGSAHVVRDFSVARTFAWTPASLDGSYDVQVSARDNITGETASSTATFLITSRVTGRDAVVSATANPLVALISLPPCPVGRSKYVTFRREGAQYGQATPPQPCRPPSSVNFYVAGMYADSNYTITPVTKVDSAISPATALSFHTGVPSNVMFPALTVLRPADIRDSPTERVLLIGGIGANIPFASDLNGGILWYYLPASPNPILTRLISGGTMLIISDGVNSQNSATQAQVLREIDLAGNIVRETNATRIQEQLAAMGAQSSCVTGSSQCLFGAFHHEAIRLPNGHTIALGSEERIFPAGTQGSAGNVDILGDILVDLDEDWQVVWYWSAFDHLDINRGAVLHETCAAATLGCPQVFLASEANDWLHGNSIQLTADGNLLYSTRHQDWVIKIDYGNGAGTGAVLWRMGLDGDFSIQSGDLWPWFSHQHDAGFEPGGTLTVFDNGNTRVAANPGQYSRGQAFTVDESGRIVTPLLNASLGVYSPALGSAQLLHNGNYHFLPGLLNPGLAEFMEVSPKPKILFTLQSSAGAYRSFRLMNLYTPPAT